MNKDDFRHLIKQGESETLEFKKSTAELDAAFKTACAFLNTSGGAIIIGITDQGKVVGQDISDSTKKAIAEMERKITPSANFNISYHDVDGKKVILIKVNRGTQVPYVYDGRPFQRIQSTTQKMSQSHYEELLISRKQINYSWEKSNSETGYDDIDEDLLFGIVRKGVEKGRLPEVALREDKLKMLERLNLFFNGVLNNAGVVLFGKRFMPAYPQCQLKLARFKGIDKSEFLDQNIVYGNVFLLLDEATLFIKRHLPMAGKIESEKLERVEAPLIPFKAIREAMLNALCHKDYSITGGSILLAIYDDRMEIINDGGLLDGITVSKIKSGLSRQRNQIIADVFYKGCLIEKFGRGIQEIIQNCLSAGDPEPEFYSDDTQFKVVFKFPNPLVQSLVKSLMDSYNTYLQELKENNTYPSLTLRQLDILRTIFSHVTPIKAKNILEKLKDPVSDRQLRRDLAVLKQRGLIETQGRAQTAEWFLLRK